ncbi:unnamed protein product [Rotaria socialis]|uniref:Uncharacterized protein n=1 Tax=Rotaria socialis TaxID=392032 RepID=A0A817PEC8_9BILA|nr:unnamed protein product [Rotaria socialis]CAF4280223.1 unnamed protein product [Rotaria socialis]
MVTSYRCISTVTNQFYLPTFIEQLLDLTTKLIHFAIAACKIFNDVVDGIAWERILSKIITFKFSFMFDDSVWTKKSIRLDSFRTPFWLEKKNGDIIIESTGPQDFSFSNINQLRVYWKSPMNNELIRRFTHVQQLYVNDSEKSFCMMLADIIPYLDLSTIITFIIANYYTEINIDIFIRLVCRISHLRIIGASITLLKLLCIYHWANISILKIFDQYEGGIVTKYDLTLNEIGALFRSFSHVKQIHFMHDDIYNLSVFLNNISMTVSNVVLEHRVNITPTTYSKFLTREWLEQNTQLHNFSYSCDKHKLISIWL